MRREDFERLIGLSYGDWCRIRRGDLTELELAKAVFDREPFKVGDSVCFLKGVGELSAGMVRAMGEGRNVVFARVLELDPTPRGCRVVFVREGLES